MDNLPSLAIIGGSGLYEMPGLKDPKEYDLDTPFGKPSAPIIVGTLEERKIAFLARHGIGHHISPSEINFRANIYALKSLGVERIVSISACGSLREDYIPGDIVVPSQLFDFTRGRKRSFFEAGWSPISARLIPSAQTFPRQSLRPCVRPARLRILAGILSPSKGRASQLSPSQTPTGPGACPSSA